MFGNQTVWKTYSRSRLRTMVGPIVVVTRLVLSDIFVWPFCLCSCSCMWGQKLRSFLVVGVELSHESGPGWTVRFTSCTQANQIDCTEQKCQPKSTLVCSLSCCYFQCCCLPLPFCTLCCWPTLPFCTGDQVQQVQSSSMKMVCLCL